MSGKDKRKSMTAEGKDNAGDGQKPAKKVKKNRFLAFLQRVWRRIGGTRVRTSSQQGSSEKHPGPRSINVVDNRADVSPKEEENNSNTPAEVELSKKLCEEEPQELQNPKEAESVSICTGPDPVVSSCPSSESSERTSQSKESGASACQVEETPATNPLSLDSFISYKTLGEGSFGKVMLAEEKKSKTWVAIKMVEKWGHLSVNCILTERNILKFSPLSPYLIHGLGAFNTENYVCFVMEFAARGDLNNFIKNYYPFHNDTIEFIMAELVCGVQTLHEYCTLHRDLKPANILITAKGHIKISDFGVSIITEETTEGNCGSPRYTAPEVVLGQQYGPAADYFSLGAIFYELCTRKKAFPRAKVGTVNKAKPKLPRRLPNVWGKFLQGLLHKDPNQRLCGDDVRRHPFFSNINWEDVDDFRLQPPKQILDTDYQDPDIVFNKDRVKKAAQRKVFQDFNFLCPELSAHYRIK